ncbi:MAG TPA: tetratricopeptide repeat protein [Bellilinea sp.]|nr:tetratricopeptide repeat protein [Bellilinea sp.]
MDIHPDVGSLLDRRYRLLSKAYYGLINEVIPVLENDFSADSITRLDEENLNLYDLFPTMIEREECPLEWLVPLYVYLVDYLMMRGMYVEMVNWGVDLFERFKRVPATPPVALLDCLGTGLGALNRFDDAKIVYDLILRLYQHKLNDADQTAIHFNLARLHLEMGEMLKAGEYCKLAVESDERRGNRRGFALGLNLLADIFWKNDQFAESLQVMRQALEVAREIGNAHMITNMTSDLARHMDGQCDPTEVAGVYEEAIHLLDERHDLSGLARTYHNYAWLCRKNGWHEKAYTLANLSMKINEDYDPSEYEQTRRMVADWQREDANQRGK